MKRYLGKKAIVLGGSISGVLSARVLSDFFEEVIILEKDNLSNLKMARNSVPQSRHLHVLLETGLKNLDDFFPSFSDKLIEKGSSIIDSQNDVAWFHFGGWKKRYKSNLRLALQSRPLLESTLRETLLEQCKNVTIRTQIRVNGLLYDRSKQKISGVKVVNNNKRIDKFSIMGDLIVDCMGRNSRCNKWLSELGYGIPENKYIDIGMGYTSLLMKPNKNFLKEYKALFVHPYPPYNTKYGAVIPHENDENGNEQYIVALSGCLGDHAPKDFDGFLNFASKLDNDAISDFIRNAEPVSDFSYLQSKTNSRKYFENLRYTPKGIISIGDAILVPNPIYGQGMTIVSLEAKILHETLNQGIKGFEKKYYRRIGPLLNFAWDITSGENFRFPDVEGKRSIKILIQNMYTKQLFKLAKTDEKIWDNFVNVLLFLKNPVTLFKPHILYKVLSLILFSKILKK